MFIHMYTYMYYRDFHQRRRLPSLSPSPLLWPWSADVSTSARQRKSRGRRRRRRAMSSNQPPCLTWTSSSSLSYPTSEWRRSLSALRNVTRINQQGRHSWKWYYAKRKYVLATQTLGYPNQIPQHPYLITWQTFSRSEVTFEMSFGTIANSMATLTTFGLRGTLLKPFLYAVCVSLPLLKLEAACTCIFHN